MKKKSAETKPRHPQGSTDSQTSDAFGLPLRMSEIRITPAMGISRVTPSQWPTPSSPVSRIDVLSSMTPKRDVRANAMTYAPPAGQKNEVIVVTNAVGSTDELRAELDGMKVDTVTSSSALLERIYAGQCESTFVIFDGRQGHVTDTSVLKWLAAGDTATFIVFWGAPSSLAGWGRKGLVEWVVCEKDATSTDVALLVLSLRERSKTEE